MKSLEEFISFYEFYGYCINDCVFRKNRMNKKQLKSRYNKYISSEKIKILRMERLQEKDFKWEDLKSKIDLTTCSFLSLLEREQRFKEVGFLKEKANILLKIIDPAHIFGKGAYPHLKYDVDNIAPLNRFSHSMLDQNKDPITGENISFEKKMEWWIYLIGKEKMDQLYLKAMRRENE